MAAEGKTLTDPVVVGTIAILLVTSAGKRGSGEREKVSPRQILTHNVDYPLFADRMSCVLLVFANVLDYVGVGEKLPLQRKRPRLGVGPWIVDRPRS